MVPKHNTKAILVGTGEFRFCPGAKSKVEARLKGYRDVGNIAVFTPETDTKVEEHQGSYRGRKIVDKKYSTSEKLEYVITEDEWKKANLALLFMATDAEPHTQAALVASAGDTFAFTVGTTSSADRWYPVTVNGSRVRVMTSLAVAVAPAVAVVADATGDKITETAHGRLAGDAVLIGGTAAPAGLTLGGIYYVTSPTTNDYKLAASAGGAPIDLTTAGTAVTVRKVLVEGTDVETDPVLGAVRFIAKQTTTVYPIVTAPAIAAPGDPGYMYGLKPLEQPIQEGYGEMICYDEDPVNPVILHHEEFSCSLSAEKSSAVDGAKATEFQVRVTVTTDVGKLYVREDEPA